MVGFLWLVTNIYNFLGVAQVLPDPCYFVGNFSIFSAFSSPDRQKLVVGLQIVSYSHVVWFLLGLLILDLVS